MTRTRATSARTRTRRSHSFTTSVAALLCALAAGLPPSAPGTAADRLVASEEKADGRSPAATSYTNPVTADVVNGPMFGGPTANSMWLRLSYHHHDAANNENEVRAATSRDGAHWVRNGVWTLPRKGDLKIGLVSLNRTGAVAQFDYVRAYRG